VSDSTTEISTRDDDAAITELYQAKNQTWLEDETLASIRTIEDAFDTLLGENVEVEDFDDYGPGFSVVDKSVLVGVPMLLLEWRFVAGDFDGFVSVAAVTQDGRKVIFNDGSTGIRAQLEKVTQSRKAKGNATPQMGLKVMGGLRVSQYTYTDDKGKERPAETYYLGNA